MNKREGAKIKARFLAKTPALKKLIEDVQSFGKANGYVRGLDGRRINIRSEHSALNFLLQGGGAIICKQWMSEFHKVIRAQGWQDSVRQVAWIHDELQIECTAGLAQQVGEAAVAAIKTAGDILEVKVPLTGEFNVGNNWAETH